MISLDGTNNIWIELYNAGDSSTTKDRWVQQTVVVFSVTIVVESRYRCCGLLFTSYHTAFTVSKVLERTASIRCIDRKSIVYSMIDWLIDWFGSSKQSHKCIAFYHTVHYRIYADDDDDHVFGVFNTAYHRVRCACCFLNWSKKAAGIARAFGAHLRHFVSLIGSAGVVVAGIKESFILFCVC